MSTKKTKQPLPTLKDPANLVGTPFCMEVQKYSPTKVKTEYHWSAWFDDCSDLVPAWFEPGVWQLWLEEGSCDTLAKAQAMALKTVQKAQRGYQSNLASIGKKLIKQIEKDLLAMTK